MEHDTGLPSGRPDPGDARDVIGNGPGEGDPRGSRTATVAVTALLLVAAGGAAAWAAGTGQDAARPPVQYAAEGAPAPSPGTPSPATPSPATPTPGPQGRGEGPARIPFGGAHGLPGALHGDLTLPDGEGTRQVRVQRGAVTAVSATSLTVRSTDGYSSTYVVDGSTRVDRTTGSTASLAVGDEVAVLADLDGDKATAREVHERRAPVAGEGAPPLLGRQHAPHQRREGASPAPSTGPSTAPSPSPSAPGGEGSSSRVPGGRAGSGLQA